MKRTDGNEILIPDGPKIGWSQGHQGLRPSGGGDELNLDPFFAVDLDHGAQVSLSEPLLGDISVKNNCIENLERHG